MVKKNKLIEPLPDEKVIEDINKDIEDSASKGFLGVEYGLGHNIHHSVIDYITDVFVKQGFDVDFKYDRTFVKLNVSWG